MSDATCPTRASIAALSREQISQAGHRYTPGVDPNAPNLRIKFLFDAIENVACGAGAFARLSSVLDEFEEAWGRARHCSQQAKDIDAKASAARTSLPSLLVRLRARDEGAGREWSARLSEIDTCLAADMAHWRAEEAKLPAGESGGDSSSANTIRGHMHSLGRCLTVLRDEIEYAQGPAFKALFDPFLLIRGEWGTGKTHLLCDVTQERIGRGQPTVLVLAKNFRGNVLADICARITPGLTPAEVLDELQELGSKGGERAIVILDGVNEGLRSDWRQAIGRLQELISKRPHVGLVVTCRTPFESLAIKPSDLPQYNKVTHVGFEDQEFDAQAAYFHYYKLPLPEVPLLDKEFARPLTLKLICQSLQHLTGKKLQKGFSGIASGQRGMTFVLESFVNRVGESIEREFGLKDKGCWLLLKGNDRVNHRRLAGFAPCMAANLRGFVRLSEADRIIAANYPAFRPAMRRRLLEALRTSGLIEEDVVWYSAKSGVKSRIVMRLPYQRFSDHLIARHLLKAHLDTSTSESIEKSFAGRSPLARIFRLSNRYRHEYTDPGWAQALITEFPERVGTKLPPKRRELFFVLPKRSRSANAYFGPFVEGLFWRDPSTFTEGTLAIVNRYLNSGSQAWERLIDALVAVSTKPAHPYYAKRIYAYLAGFQMPDRDLAWSEYLRRRYASPTIHRLLTWAQKLDSVAMKQGSAAELVVVLSLVLTTVARGDRDLATKALVLIGEKFPRIVFDHAITSLGFNDPYVPERMLAAAYGTTLSLVDSMEKAEFRPLLGDFAEALYRNMFQKGSPHATHHTLMRDYALGIIQVALRAGCVSLPNAAVRDMLPPFRGTASTFSRIGVPDQHVQGAIGHPIHMDFGNYTIGRLIPNRSNYDDKNPDYIKVRAKIERRIFDLGYRAEPFKAADSEIGSRYWNASDEVKVDRYGKKYAWIAYFEMWGEREAAGKLSKGRIGERTSDCGVDPSFPKRPPDWIPPIPNLFGDQHAETERWVAGGFTPSWDQLLVVPEINGHPGEWILLEGFVQRADRKNNRELFAFLRGLFVAPADVLNLKRKFLSVDYPGNHTIPEGATEYYLFGGEAGRRQNFARRLYQKNGTYARQFVEAFDRYVPARTKSKASPTKIVIKSISGDGKEGPSFVRHLGPIQKMRRVPGVRLEVPFIHFGWESYHSSQNEFSGFNLPEPSLIERLGLASRSREIDFYDSSGTPGTLYRHAGEGWSGDRHSLLYIRADLLRRYLSKTRQVLVWCNWGERDWHKKMEGNDVIREPARQRIYQRHAHIHRSFSQWSTKDSKVK